MDIRIRVGDDEVELFSVGEEVGGEDFDVGGGFAEEAELVGVLLWADDNQHWMLGAGEQ